MAGTGDAGAGQRGPEGAGIRATAKGRKLLFEGRERRIARLASGIAQLTREEGATVAAAAAIIERLSLPPDHPARHL